jgi:hypothetical protein
MRISFALSSLFLAITGTALAQSQSPDSPIFA